MSISDMLRKEGESYNDKAGMELLKKLRDKGDNTPVVFYIGKAPTGDPPESSIGITQRPDKLLLLVLRALQGSKKG